MTYQETIEYLYNATPVFEKIGAGAYKEGLENTLALDEHFGHPHRKLIVYCSYLCCCIEVELVRLYNFYIVVFSYLQRLVAGYKHFGIHFR